VEDQQPLLIAADGGAANDRGPSDVLCTGLLHWTGISLRRDRARQVRNPGTREHRDSNGHHEVDRVADHIAAIQPSAVLPGSARSLSAGLTAPLKRRCTAQRAEISRRSGAVIAHRVPRNDQGSTAQCHDDA